MMMMLWNEMSKDKINKKLVIIIEEIQMKTKNINVELIMKIEIQI